MVLTLIQNVALVVMLATVQRYLARHLDAYPRLERVMSGILYGAVVVVGMLTPFHFAAGIFYDGRSIILSLAGLFGGVTVAVVATVIASAYRMALGGVGVVAGVTTIVVSAALGVALHFVRRRRPRSMRTLDLLAFGLIVHVFMLAAQYFLLPDDLGVTVVREVGLVVITLFPLGTALAARMIIEQQEREEARSDLVREAERLRLAMSTADEGTWDYDITTNSIRLSPEAARLFGFAQEPVLLAADEWLASVHPDDRAALLGQQAEVLEGQRAEVQWFYRMQQHGGAYRWLQSVGKVIDRDAAGTPLRMLGIVVDISATRKAAEAVERRAIEAELLANASAKLLRCRDRDAAFGIIHDFFAATFPADIVIVNAIVPGGEWLVVQDIIGVGDALLAHGEKLIGGAIFGRTFPVTPEYRVILEAGSMERIEGGVAEIAAGQLPVGVSHGLEQLFGLHDFWSIGVADAGLAYAGVHVLTRRPNAEVPAGVVESFANLCFVTLARIEAETHLMESEERFRTLVDTAPDAIFVQTDYRFAYVNEAACNLYGAASPDELVGHPVWERFHPDFREVIAQRMEAVNVHRQPQGMMDMVHLRLDGSEVHIQTTGAPIVYDGDNGAVVFVRDVTEARLAALELERHREHLEDLVAERTRELEVTNTELERATRAKSAFLARMSHELRTPLNSIIGFSSVLMQGLAGEMTEEQRVQVGTINSAGRHLLSIINDLLDISLVEAGRTRVEFSEMNPAAVLADVAETLRSLADEKGLEMRLRVPDEALTITSDAGKVKQILLNLGGNAITYTQSGHIELALGIGGADSVVFTVSDTGPGIREELFTRIFESFTQGDISPDDVPKGTGLGLTISRDFARMLGGEIGVTSELGVGSTFTLTLPRTRP